VALTRELYRATRDLGLPGVDPVYGHGLLQAAAVCGARATAGR
jgi:hypothetical protein